MEKSIFEQIGGTYHQEGDYLLPDLVPPESFTVGIWGQRRRRYLKEHREPLYTAMLLSGKLESYLAELNQQAEDTFFQLIKHIAEQDGITEQLKAENQLEWVGTMNSIRNRAEEIIFNDYIYS